MWRPGGLRPPGDGVRAVRSTGGGIGASVHHLLSPGLPCASRRLRALPTLLRVRLYVSEAAEGGVVGATVPARAGPRPPADLFAAAGARLPDFELSEAALPLATTFFSWIFIRPAENSLQKQAGNT